MISSDAASNESKVSCSTGAKDAVDGAGRFDCIDRSKSILSSSAELDELLAALDFGR